MSMDKSHYNLQENKLDLFIYLFYKFIYKLDIYI